MDAAQPPLHELPSNDWDQMQALVSRFEAAWRSGPQPVLDDYLPAASDQRRALLIELIHTDLELSPEGQRARPGRELPAALSGAGRRSPGGAPADRRRVRLAAAMSPS